MFFLLIRQGDADVPIRVRNKVVHVHAEGANMQAVVGVATDDRIAHQIPVITFYIRCASHRLEGAGRPLIPPLMQLRCNRLFTREGDADGPSRVRNKGGHVHAEGANMQAVDGGATDERIIAL